MKNFTGKQIDAFCKVTEDFVAETLCPQVEKVGECAPGSQELESALYATLRTVAHKIHIKDIGFAKDRDGNYVVLDKSKGKPEKDAKEDGEKERSSEPDEEMAEEISELIAQIVKAAKKYATDKDDFSTTLSSAAMTILTVGGPSAMADVVMHLIRLV